MAQGSQQNSGSASSGVGISNGVNSGINGSFNTGQNGTFGQTNSANNSFNQGSSTSTGKSSGGSSSSSRSNDRIWKEQSPYLADMYKQAQDAFNNGLSSIEGMTPELTQQVQDAYLQGADVFGNQAQGGFSAGLMDKIGQNNYLNALKGDIVSDAGKLKQQTLGSLDARAAAAGMSGSSGYRDQVADSYGEIDEAALQQMNQLGYNSFNQGLQNQIGLAGQMDANANNALGMTGAMQQAALSQANPAMLQQQLAQQYAQTLGGPATLNSASSSSSSSNSSKNNSVSNQIGMSNGFSNGMNMGFGNTMGGSFGANGGMNQGTNVSNSTGNSSGTALGLTDKGGAALLAMSDANLKENIRLVDHIDGINMYEWDWKDESISSPMNYGVIAQEVAITHPEAVSVAGNGYLVVDYTQLGGAGRAAMSRMEASA
jgi:hypothetical protein